MIEQMTVTPRSPRPRMPVQAAPIDRHPVLGSAVPGGAGVEADWGLDDIIGGVGKVVDVATKAAPLISGIAGLFSDRAVKTDVRPVRWNR